MYQNKQGQPRSANVRTQNLKLNSRSVSQTSSRPFETTFSPIVSPSDGFCSATLDNNSYDLYSSGSSLYNDQMLWESAFEVPEIKLESEPISNELPNLVKDELADDVLVNTSWQNEPLGREIKEEIEESGETKNVESGQNRFAQGLKHISAYEEYELLRKLEQSKSLIGCSLEARRLYRKLQVRRARRTENLPQFDFDRLVRKLAGQYEPVSELEQLERDKENDERILDRFQIKPKRNFSLREYSSFKARLLGDDEVQQKSFISPYTKKVLKTVIWRDNEAKPLKLKILQGILSAPLNKGKRGGDHPCSFVPEVVPMPCIEYRYIQPSHIPTINAMARNFFWPGIDISDCLQYPDFTCVALYKKVIIGFGIMVPDVSFNEAYISFLFTHPEWRNAGISTFILYHLLQTSLGKDITLHVEATNPAVFLYQKFCFKIEEFIADFYDKYLPASSSQCKHALFMRLSR